ncbi:MAG: protein-L-isoaspartate(D-aspartate) O-methyltransferase [Elusimicrobiota bacterium]
MDIFKKLGEKYEKYFDYLNQKMIVEQIIKRGVKNTAIIEAIKTTKRHLFLPDNLKLRAYDDCAIEVAKEQTISQPYIVAFMIELLDPQPDEKVLEIGTGTGWQTVILSKLFKQVYTIEIKDTLYEFAKNNIQKYARGNVASKIDNGYNGWEEFSQFDKIILSCAPVDLPEKLIEQLKINGRMVLPVGESFQKLKIINKKSENEIEVKDSIDVIFLRMEKLNED